MCVGHAKVYCFTVDGGLATESCNVNEVAIVHHWAKLRGLRFNFWRCLFCSDSRLSTPQIPKKLVLVIDGEFRKNFISSFCQNIVIFTQTVKQTPSPIENLYG